jgi:beta-catenin-like protein 1
VSVTVEDEDEDLQDQRMAGNDDDDGSFAPGNDADYFVEEDEEGRFFGGGLNSQQKEILDIFEGHEGQDDNTDTNALTVQGVRRQLLNLERSINKNSEMRVKWAGQPDKWVLSSVYPSQIKLKGFIRFVDSEVNLDSSIRELLLLTQNPREFYPELSKLGIINSLVDLLSHENVDISIIVIEALEELTDDDVTEGDADSDDEQDVGSGSARQAVVNLANALIAAQIVELSIDNLNRLQNEQEEEQDRSGVYHTLGLIENLLSLQPNLSKAIATKTKLVEWLLKRLQPPALAKNDKGKGQQEDPALSQNRYYAAELLAIILQGTDTGKEARAAVGKCQGIEIALKVLSVRSFAIHAFLNQAEDLVAIRHTGRETHRAQTRQNTWRMCLISCVLPFRSLRTRRSS